MNLNKTSGIYKITNIVNNRCYIGSSVQIGIRFQQHKSRLKKDKHHSQYLQRAWNLHGESSFIFEILEKCDESIHLIREQFYMDTLKPEYNVEKIAGKPPQHPEISRKTMKAIWASGKFDNQLKPFERIDPNTGEVKEYRSSSEAEVDGFLQQSISAACNGKKASYANYYWRFLDGSTPESTAAYEKIFIKVRGTKDDGSILELFSFDDCNVLGFSYGKIRACCEGQRGRRTHNGYKWNFIDNYKQEVASDSKARTFSEVFCKRVIRESVDGIDIKFYESQAATKLDGFDPRKVSMCCLGRRKTHGNYKWNFVNEPQRL